MQGSPIWLRPMASQGSPLWLWPVASWAKAFKRTSYEVSVQETGETCKSAAIYTIFYLKCKIKLGLKNPLKPGLWWSFKPGLKPLVCLAYFLKSWGREGTISHFYWSLHIDQAKGSVQGFMQYIYILEVIVTMCPLITQYLQCRKCQRVAKICKKT